MVSLITLNTWGGRMEELLYKLLRDTKNTTDIFCLQEVFSCAHALDREREYVPNLHEKVSDILRLDSARKFNSFFDKSSQGFDYSGKAEPELYFGLGIYVNKEMPFYESGSEMIYDDRNLDEGKPRNLQWLITKVNSRTVSIAHFHGIANVRKDKSDSDARIEQAYNVREILDELPGEKILCGDFNLMPETKSMEILSKGMKNLIIENKITSTRPAFYAGEEKYADYVLVTDGIEVKGFEVMQVPVSNHYSLKLGFEL